MTPEQRANRVLARLKVGEGPGEVSSAMFVDLHTAIVDAIRAAEAELVAEQIWEKMRAESGQVAREGPQGSA